MTLCYLGLGSNLKKPERLIRQAIHSLRKSPRINVLKIANLETTAPWGILSQPAFCNTVIGINTTLSPIQLLVYCQKLEQRFGRVRKKRWGPRTLDIDILLYAGKTISTHKLILPHPWIFHRDFVMKPLRDLGAFEHKAFRKLDVDTQR